MCASFTCLPQLEKLNMERKHCTATVKFGDRHMGGEVVCERAFGDRCALQEIKRLSGGTTETEVVEGECLEEKNDSTNSNN